MLAAHWPIAKAALVGGAAGILGSFLQFRRERERLHAEFKTERSVEAALQAFLGLPDHPYRSFPMIRHHIGGFGSNALRQLLVRAGAVRFVAADGTEMWALLHRVESEFSTGRWKLKEEPSRPADDQLFPGLFDEKEEL